jgi:hypothetical protein
MTFFQNPHRGFAPPNNIQQSAQNFVPVGPNLLQDPRTGIVYMQTPQGLVVYNQNPQAPMQQPMQMPMQQPMQMPMQPGMMQPMYPNPGMAYPNMQPNLAAGFNNVPASFNNMQQNAFNQDQVSPSFNPRFNTPDLRPNNANTTQSRYGTDANTSQPAPTPNVQSWSKPPEGSNMTQVAEPEKPNLKFSEIDLRYSTFIPFATRIKEKEFKYQEFNIGYIFTDPCDFINLCMEAKNQDENIEEDTVLVASDVKVGREYFIANEEDKDLIKDLFKNDKSIKAFINNFTYALNNVTSGDALSYLIDYNRFITEQINYILDKYLQTKVSIDSFVDDYFELLNALEKQIQDTNVVDIISTEIIKANSYTRVLMEDTEEKLGIYAVAVKETIVVVPDVVEIYTRHYYDNKVDTVLNPKDDAKFIKLVDLIIEQLKDKFDIAQGFIMGFTNCKYINVNILNLNNTTKTIIS